MTKASGWGECIFLDVVSFKTRWFRNVPFLVLYFLPTLMQKYVVTTVLFLSCTWVIFCSSTSIVIGVFLLCAFEMPDSHVGHIPLCRTGSDPFGSNVFPSFALPVWAGAAPWDACAHPSWAAPEQEPNLSCRLRCCPDPAAGHFVSVCFQFHQICLCLFSVLMYHHPAQRWAVCVFY